MKREMNEHYYGGGADLVDGWRCSSCNGLTKSKSQSINTAYRMMFGNAPKRNSTDTSVQNTPIDAPSTVATVATQALKDG